MHRRVRPFAVLGSLTPFQGAAVGADDKSVNFDGSTEVMQTLQGAVTLGPNNAWTIGIWIKPAIAGPSDYFFDTRASGTTNVNRIRAHSSSLGPTSLEVNVYDSSGVQQKVYRVAGGITNSAWALYTFAFDGAVGGDPLTIFKNGVDLSPTKVTDNACTQSSSLHQMILGATWNPSPANYGACNIHSVAVWDEALTSAEQLAVYNSGDGTNFDLSQNSGDYTSSANLVRWWRLGLDAGDIGKDYVSGDIDLMDDAANIDSGDIDSDSPT